MIETDQELAVCKERLQELHTRYRAILADSHKSARMKELELAGVRGMIKQIESEVMVYLLSQIQQAIQALRTKVQDTERLNVPQALDETLGVLNSVTDAIRLTGVARL